MSSDAATGAMRPSSPSFARTAESVSPYTCSMAMKKLSSIDPNSKI